MMSNTVDRFKEYIREQALFSPKHRLIIAVSGGLDSVVLTELCHLAGYHFVIAHVNFRLRGAESDADEEFVRKLALDKAVPFHLLREEAAKYAAENKLSVQEAAREIRYRWFHQLREELLDNKESPAVILTAHHLDDSAETMMMNFFRGTGIAGLRGILSKQGALVRPLLCFDKSTLHQFASDAGLQWVTDRSNAESKYTRNFFRNDIMPMVRKVYPTVDQNLYENLERFQQAHILYRESVDRHLLKLLVPFGAEWHLPIRKLIKLPAFETILFEALQQFGFGASQLPGIIKLLNSETGSQILSATHRVIKNRHWLIIAPVLQEAAAHIQIDESGSDISYANGTLSFRVVERSKLSFKPGHPATPLNAAPHMAFFDARLIKFPLLLRRAKPGDYLYPLGMKKKKKLARMLIDLKLSKTEKEKVWVLESAKRIIWVIGYRIDDRFCIGPGTTEILCIAWKQSV